MPLAVLLLSFDIIASASSFCFCCFCLLSAFHTQRGERFGGSGQVFVWGFADRGVAAASAAKVCTEMVRRNLSSVCTPCVCVSVNSRTLPVVFQPSRPLKSKPCLLLLNVISCRRLLLDDSPSR